MHRILVLAFALAGCDRLAPDTEHEFQNEGKICLFPEGTQTEGVFLRPDLSFAFAADQGLVITVTAPGCLSSSCSKDRKAQCTTMVKGNVIEVTSSASFKEEGGTRACTDDCGFLVARCTTPPLPAGTYQVQHGAERLTLTVPSTMQAPCAGKAP